MLALAHFAVGVGGGAILLMLFPTLIPNLLKNDVIFLIASGFWAMLPDLQHVGINIMEHGAAWQNIFWMHTFLDKYPDTPTYIAYALVFMLLSLYVYYGGL